MSNRPARHQVEIIPSIRIIYPWTAMNVGDDFIVPTEHWSTNQEAQTFVCNAIHARKRRNLPERYKTTSTIRGIIVTRVR